MKKFTIVVSVLFVILGGCFVFYREGTLPVDKNTKETKGSYNANQSQNGKGLQIGKPRRGNR